MPFPFLPGGLLLALTVLGGAFAVFAAALNLLDRAASSARGSIAAGLEAGLRTWGQSRQGERGASAPGAGEPALGPFRLAGVRPWGTGRRRNAWPGEVVASEADDDSPASAELEEIDAGGASTQRVRPRREP
jgi:hypothetical protein